MFMRDGQWIKASLSYANGNCVEVRSRPDGRVEVRNSRYPDTRLPPFTPAEWQAFLAGVRSGEFG
jgi:predicted secreted Zn-dependent protease